MREITDGEVLDRGQHLALSALTALTDLVSDRLGAFDLDQQSMIEAIVELEWLADPVPRTVAPDDLQP
jgi:hypothetical protein